MPGLSPRSTAHREPALESAETAAAPRAARRVSVSDRPRESPPRAWRSSEIDFEIILTSAAGEALDSAPPRSKLEGNKIIVNVSHPDFVERLKKTRVGKETFDSRLLSYLAAVVSAHYRGKTPDRTLTAAAREEYRD